MKYHWSSDPDELAKTHGVSRQWVYRNTTAPPEPTMDADGYPTHSTELEIRNWPINSNRSVKLLLEYVAKAWRYNFIVRRGYTKHGEPFIHIATSGWSGNECLVEALMDNHLFRALCWLSSHRGGAFEFITKPFYKKS